MTESGCHLQDRHRSGYPLSLQALLQLPVPSLHAGGQLLLEAGQPGRQLGVFARDDLSREDARVGGAANAGIFAAQIIARKDPELATRLARFKEELAAGVEARDRKLQESLKA